MSEETIERAIALAEAWKRSPDPELFEERVLPALRPILKRAEASSDARTLADWLETYATVVGVADEELATLTAELIEAQPDSAAAARPLLSASAQARLALFLEGWASDSDADLSEFESLQAASLAGNQAALDVTNSRQVLVRFVGESSFTSSRGFPVVKGTMTVRKRDGSVAGAFSTTTGGGASTFRKTNGPVPPGTYVVSNFMIRDKFGMVAHGIGYSLNLDPVAATPVFGRRLFRIHPDGASPGTNGCLGVAEGLEKLKASRDILKSLLQDGNYLASVGYDGFG